jgi:putative flippase GtrA
VQFLRFLIVGTLATALHYAVLIGLVQSGLAVPVVASSIGFALSAAFNYAANRHYTFRSARDHTAALPRFVAVMIVGLAINASVLWFLSEPLRQPYLLAQVIATGFTLFWNFTANRRWTFSEASA